jgi:hypothetical protein
MFEDTNHVSCKEWDNEKLHACQVNYYKLAR